MIIQLSVVKWKMSTNFCMRQVNNFFGTWGNRLYKQTYPMALSGNGAGLMYDRDKWLLGEF